MLASSMARVPSVWVAPPRRGPLAFSSRALRAPANSCPTRHETLIAGVHHLSVCVMEALAAMTYRYQAKILDHTVSIKKNPLEKYEVLVSGPAMSTKHYWTFLTVDDAKLKAHAFVHATLNRPCHCPEIHWTVAIDKR